MIAITDQFSILIDGVDAGQVVDVVLNHAELRGGIMSALAAWRDSLANAHAAALAAQKADSAAALAAQKADSAAALAAQQASAAAHASVVANLHAAELAARDQTIADLTEQRDALGTTEQAQAIMAAQQKAALEAQIADAQAQLAALAAKAGGTPAEGVGA